MKEGAQLSSGQRELTQASIDENDRVVRHGLMENFKSRVLVVAYIILILSLH
jgi:hypothetical protein